MKQLLLLLIFVFTSCNAKQEILNENAVKNAWCENVCICNLLCTPFIKIGSNSNQQIYLGLARDSFGQVYYEKYNSDWSSNNGYLINFDKSLVDAIIAKQNNIEITHKLQISRYKNGVLVNTGFSIDMQTSELVSLNPCKAKNI